MLAALHWNPPSRAVLHALLDPTVPPLRLLRSRCGGARSVG